MNIPQEQIEQWYYECPPHRTQFEYIASRAAEWAVTQEREPLSEERILNLVDMCESYFDFARAIERCHGIGVKK